ncbi:MAG TPA: TolC family protein [Rhizomicrobium sp.]|jgi:NodT family efflux transporter outer membrane factor (OMF) lipoprotein|nr:TolC family protein [Rhizomicrobium sp.]
MNSLMRSSSFAVLALAIAGCTTAPPQALKPGDMPQGFTAPQTPDMANAPVWPNTTDWWNGFGASELPPLETTANAENLDLLAAAARVEQAAANTGIASSALFPLLEGNGQATRSGSNVHSGVPGVSSTGNTFGIGAQASYELDLWGLNRDQLRAAEQNELGARYAAQTVRLTITADVANTYMDVLALRERIAIAKRNIDAAKRILVITEAKVTNGVSSNLELAQQKAQLAGEEAAIPQLEEQEREARYALAILLGRAPENFDVQAQNLDGIAPPPVKPGLPSELLERRPDVAQAEAQLLSAHANVDAARAAFFPHIDLNGSVTQFFDPSSLAWSIGASLLQTIFDGGKLTYESRLARAEQTEFLVDYRKAVFSALSDVESSMGQVTSLTDQERFVTEQVTNAREASRISELQYREGVTDLLTVLQTQQTQFTAEDELVQIKLARLQANVSLYRALGGGWTVGTDPNAAHDTGWSPL